MTILGIFWILPINRFYLGVSRGLFIRIITLNYCWLGAVYDCFIMDKLYKEIRPKSKPINNAELYKMAEKLNKMADELPDDELKLKIDID